jgi:hypothetical protein
VTTHADHDAPAGPEADQAALAYPHRRNDCDCCAAFDADMAAHYPGGW